MFNNYLKTAIRNIFKNRLNSILNITGLALGLASSLLIILHVKDEFSYDKFFPKQERIYRITAENQGENAKHWAVVSPVHAEEILKEIPEIETAGRLFYVDPQVLSYKSIDTAVK